jgi:hypothetical protein
MTIKRDNSGTLGRNTRREKDSHPTHSGRCTVAGVEYWISAWVKDGQDGSKFFSLAFKPKEEQPAAKQAQPAGGEFQDDLDIPF